METHIAWCITSRTHFNIHLPSIISSSEYLWQNMPYKAGNGHALSREQYFSTRQFLISVIGYLNWRHSICNSQNVMPLSKHGPLSKCQCQWQWYWYFDADSDYLTHVNVTVFLQKLLLLNVNIFTYINTFLPLWDNFANKKQSELAVTIPKNTTKITMHRYYSLMSLHCTNINLQKNK